MSEKVNIRHLLTVESSPHIAAKTKTLHIMLDVCIALVPAGVASVILFGWRSLLVIGATTISCVVFEFLWNLLLKKKQSVGDLSAIVTGLLLSYNLPSTIPIWQPIIGALFAIVVVKQLFGGIGMNFVNPALAARIAMVISFPTAMTNYGFPANMPDIFVSSATTDASSAATPLVLIGNGNTEGLDFLTLFLGNHGDVLGASCAAALLIGFIYMLVRGVVSPTIPLSFIGATFVFSWLFGSPAPFLSLFAGGLMLGAIFMATDYTTSPYTEWGKLIFGLGCGFLTSAIRLFASSAEGVAFSILLMNLLVPYINEWTRRRPFGVSKAKKKAVEQK